MGRRYYIPFEYGITIAYVFLGFLWILFSDKFIEGFSDDLNTISTLQTYKGWAYVFITAIFFFFFVKRHIAKLRLAEHRARESDRLKSLFLSNVSHEIRTPMNGIIGFAELLVQSNLTVKEREEYIKIVEESSERLLLLINDLVAISNLEAGAETVVLSEVRLKDLFDSFKEAYESVALAKGIKLAIDCSGNAGDISIETDREKLIAIVSRLVKNAVKYTDKGEVSVDCSVDEKFLSIFVKDTGKGIPVKVLDKVFDRFSDVDKHLSGGNEGLGLGLSIARSYARMMGGDIEAHSVEGKGSVFTVMIPIQPPRDVRKKT